MRLYLLDKKIFIKLAVVVVALLFVVSYFLSASRSSYINDYFAASNDIWIYKNEDDGMILYTKKNVPEKYDLKVQELCKYIAINKYDERKSYDSFFSDAQFAILVATTNTEEQIYLVEFEPAGTIFSLDISLTNYNVVNNGTIDGNTINATLSISLNRGKLTINFDEEFDFNFKSNEFKVVFKKSDK